MHSIFLVLIGLIVGGYASPLSMRPFYETRIVGGIPIDIEYAPYQISLQSNNFHICGGSIIDEKWVITAAHCTYGNSAGNLQVRIGSSKYSSGGEVIKVKNIFQHEDFDYSIIDYDFSLLELSESIKFTNQTNKISLPEQDEVVADDSLCLVSGWGNTQSSSESREKLRAAYVPSVNQTECANSYQDFGGITPRMICAGYKKGGKDACQGDSGGPLMSDNKLIGIVSWGFQCAMPNYPGVYSRTAAVRSWIKTNSGI